MYIHNNTEKGKPLIPEYIMCSVQRGSSPPVFVAVIYRHPDAELINSDFVVALKRHSVGFAHQIIMGDLNANMLLTEPEVIFVKELDCQLNSKLVEHGTTHHHTDEYHTWIDLIFADDNDVLDANIVATFPNRHNMIDVTIDIPTSMKPTLRKFTYRNFKDIRQEEFLSLLKDYDWSSMNCSDEDVDARLQHLSANIMTALDKVAPIKECQPKNKTQPPWVDSELRELYNKRDALRHRYLRTQNHVIRKECESLALVAERRTAEAQEAFIESRIFEAFNSGKDIWRELRSLDLLPQTRAREELHGFSPEELNSHFTGVSVSADECEEDSQAALSLASDEGFTFSKVTYPDVVLAVAHFLQAKGEDGIPQSVIAKALPKKAHLVPIKKKSIPSAVTDFRPIALLSFLSKVLEKVVHEQISGYLSSKKILDPYQSGFRQLHSTQTALLKLTEDIRAGIDNSKQLLTILLLFDFSKAFDTISPSKLLLIRMGFSRRVVLWIKSYFKGFNQKVVRS